MRALSLMAVVLCASVALPLRAAELAAAGVPMAAVWKQRKVEFHYFGRTSRYSCDGLRDKMRAMLLEMGARQDLRVTAHGCEVGGINLNGLSPGLSIEFHSPAPRGEVTAPPGGGDAKPAADAFEARYEPFVFRRDAFRNLNVGDCELVEEFLHQIIPKLSVRELKSDVTCVPYSQAGAQYRVSGEVLRAVPAANAPR